MLQRLINSRMMALGSPLEQKQFRMVNVIVYWIFSILVVIWTLNSA